MRPAHTQYVAIADSAQARLFSCDASERGPEVYRLNPIKSLENPKLRERTSEPYTETRPGLRRAGAEGGGHAVDDRRTNHRQELTRRFAKKVTNSMEACFNKHPMQILVVASPKMLGLLRDGLSEQGSGFPASNEMTFLPKNLTRLTSSQIHDQLAATGLLPARCAPSEGTN